MTTRSAVGWRCRSAPFSRVVHLVSAVVGGWYGGGEAPGDVVEEGALRLLSGEGMPLRRRGGDGGGGSDGDAAARPRGRLFVKFAIDFPMAEGLALLDEDERAQLVALLTRVGGGGGGGTAASHTRDAKEATSGGSEAEAPPPAAAELRPADARTFGLVDDDDDDTEYDDDGAPTWGFGGFIAAGI